MANEKIILSEKTVIDIRGTELVVYPVSISTFIKLEKPLSRLEKEKNMAEIAKLASEISYIILKESGNDITIEKVKDLVTMEAFQHIVQAAIGKMINIETIGQISKK